MKPTYTHTFKNNGATRLSHDGNTRNATTHAANYTPGGTAYARYTYLALCGEKAYTLSDVDRKEADPTQANREVTCDRCRRILGLRTWRQYLKAWKADRSLTWEAFKSQTAA